MTANLIQGVLQTGHVGFARPKKLWQGSLVAKKVVLGIAVGHLVFVEAAHVLPPAQDLADEAFGGGQGDPAAMVGLFDGSDDFVGG
jgi:hypothetical protein